MAEIYFYAESEKQSRNLTACIQDSGNIACALCLGSNIAPSTKNCGADKIVCLEGEDASPERYAKALAVYLTERNAAALLAESTVRGREIAALVAGFMDAPMLSDISRCEIRADEFFCEHIIYGGMMLRTSTVKGFVIATVQSGFHERDAAEKEVAVIERIVAEDVDTRVQVLSREDVIKTGVDLAAAPVTVCAGLGIQEMGDLSLLEELASICGGAICCTRGVSEDRGWLSTEQYIGISGKILSPELYLGVALSGQIQHTYGIRGAKTVAAINIDGNAPIVRASDYALIGDYREVVPAFVAALKK